MRWILCETLNFAITFLKVVILPILTAVTLNAIVARARAAEYYDPPPPPVYEPPPAVVVPPVVVPQKRFRHEHIVEHDDILDTNNWIDREICE
jgi:hypothetical protein